MKKVLMYIGGSVVGAVILFLVIYGIVSLATDKLVCKSKEGSITLMYNDKTIVGYTTKGMSYDLQMQKSYVENVGVDTYLEEFSLWFSSNTTGKCTK